MKDTTETFILKAQHRHGNKYDYSLVDYINSRTKVKIKCHLHDLIFEQLPNQHLFGHDCPICGKDKGHKKRVIPFEQFYTNALKVYGNKFKYFSNEYINFTTKTKIECPDHGVFYTKPANHLRGKTGCQKCLLETLSQKKNDIAREKFINHAKLVHGDKYDYTQTHYKDDDTKVEICCKKHGYFFQRPTSHLSGNGCGKCNSSKGEEIIRRYLKNNEIDVIEQSKGIFNDCRNPQTNRKLFFDFYLPKYNIIIEFDGAQHFQPWYRNSKDENKAMDILKGVQYRDEIKNQYCRDNKIILIRIQQKDLEKLEEILKLS